MIENEREASLRRATGEIDELYSSSTRIGTVAIEQKVDVGAKLC